MNRSDADDEDDGGSCQFPRPGATLDHGRIIVDTHLRGRMWAGHAGQRAVLIAHRDMPYSKYREAIDAWYRFDAPGVARLEYLGYPDDGGREVALAEAKPEGRPIFELPPLGLPEVARCGVGMCDAILAWGDRCPLLVGGIRPETVYVAHGQYAGMIPRIGAFAYDQDGATFDSVLYTAPSGDAPFTLAMDDAGFVAAQVLWFALLREHPYKFPGALNEDENIWNDRRRPFTGPAELGTILEAVLVADPTKRLGVRGFRDQLARLGGVP